MRHSPHMCLSVGFPEVNACDCCPCDVWKKNYITNHCSLCCCVCQCVTACSRQRSAHLNGLLWLTAHEARGSLLRKGEPLRSQHALSGGLHPRLQDRGNFPIEMRSRCLSFSVSRCRTDSVSVSPPSSSPTWTSVPSGRGEEHEHHGKGGCP